MRGVPANTGMLDRRAPRSDRSLWSERPCRTQSCTNRGRYTGCVSALRGRARVRSRLCVPTPLTDGPVEEPGNAGSYTHSMCICICIFICICVYIYICRYCTVYVYTLNIHTGIDTICIHMYIHTYVHTHTYIYIHTYFHSRSMKLMTLAAHFSFIKPAAIPSWNAGDLGHQA